LYIFAVALSSASAYDALAYLIDLLSCLTISSCLKLIAMLILTFLILTLHSGLAVLAGSTKTSQTARIRPGYSKTAPQFAQYPVCSRSKGERNWFSIGRCDEASGKARTHLVQRRARAAGALFAGHYSIVVCSCGTGCGLVFIVNLQSGRNHNFLSTGCSIGEGESYEDFLYFQADSSLLILVGRLPDWGKGAGRKERCAIRYYRWTGRRLALLKEVPLR
jgi:hypothetical protein